MTDTTKNNQTIPNQTIIFNQMPKSNGIGTAGFVLAIITIVLCWVPVLGQILWFIGLILSLIGVFKKPRGLAIAGLIVSLIGIIILVFIVAGIAGAAALSSF